MSDGVELATSLYLPDGPAPETGWPAVLVLHGLGGSRRSSNGIAERHLVSNGYTVLTVDHRGHGESGGVVDIDGPREIEDVRALVRWLGDRPDVDGARIGAIGFSLGGGAVWRATVEGVPFAAIVPVTTWTDLYEALFPGDLAKSGAVLGFLSSLPVERFSALVNELRVDLLTSRNLGAARALARDRSSRESLDRVRIPVFLIQGRRDFAFDIAQARTAFARLAGVPRRLYIGDLGHAPAPNPPAELEYVMNQARLWFDRFLKGLSNGIDTRPPVELAPDPWTGRTYQYRSLPPTRTLRLSSSRDGLLRPGGKVVRTFRLPARALETFGVPVLRVSASSTTSWPRLVAVLSAIAPDGRELVVSAGGRQTAALGRARRTLTLRLIDQSTPIPRGSRLRLTLATSSTAQSPANLLYLDTPLPGDARATVHSVHMTLPVLRRPVSPPRFAAPVGTSRGRVSLRWVPFGPLVSKRYAQGSSRKGVRMSKRSCVALVAAAVGSLALAGAASAAFEPRLGVTASEDEVTIRAALGEQDDPPARIVFYAPVGWSATLGAAAGTELGSVTGQVNAADLGGINVPVTGIVRTDNPASYVSNPCSPGTHNAVWLLVLTAGTQQLQPVPMYVDIVTTGAEASFASLKITLCLPPPDVPVGTPGRATLGVKLIDAAFTVRNVFSAGTGNRWTALFTPYQPGIGQVNVPGTAESQAVTRLGARLTIRSQRVRRRGRFFARISGRLAAGTTGIAGATVRLTANGRSAGSARTSANGSFSRTIRITRTTVFRARATSAATQETGGCEPLVPLPTGGTARCTTVTTAGYTASSTTVRTRVPRARRARR